MKLSETPTPYNIPNGMCIQTDTKEQFDELMKVLESKGWRWADTSIPTKVKFYAPMPYVYLYRAFGVPGACIRRKNKFTTNWDNEDFSLYPIHEWEQVRVVKGSFPMSSPLPKNNDNRTTCYWCEAPCKQVQGIINTYTVCTRCGK